MTITIHYQDNTKRVIKPTSAIYKVEKNEPSVNQKIEDIAYSTGKPYLIIAEEGDRIIFKKSDPRNNPKDKN